MTHDELTRAVAEILGWTDIRLWFRGPRLVGTNPKGQVGYSVPAYPSSWAAAEAVVEWLRKRGEVSIRMTDHQVFVATYGREDRSVLGSVYSVTFPEAACLCALAVAERERKAAPTIGGAS